VVVSVRILDLREKGHRVLVELLGGEHIYNLYP
jgi:hypothetical protein